MDQYKGFVDHTRDTPVTFPNLWLLRIAAVVVVVSVIAWALFA